MKRLKNINVIELIKNKWWYLIAPLFVVLEVMVVYAIKGVFPFGERTVSYFDMAQSIIPNYYHGYDVLHFTKDINLEWNVSIGTSITNEIGRFVLFPVNLFWYFVKRNNILNSMSLYICLKFALSALFMEIYCYSRKNIKSLSIILSVAYALCGMAIQYYNTSVMLDDILLFPLLVYGFNQLIKNRKKWIYVLCLYFIFTFNQHTIFFICIFLLMYAFIELREFDKDLRHTVITRILLFSITSICISAFVFIPNMLQTIISSRASAVDQGIIYSFMTILTEYQANKNFMLFASEFVLPLSLIIILNKKLKKYLLNVLLVVLMIIPILFEGVDLMWHIGSYQCFPMRFGFILTFASIELLLKSWDDISLKNKYITKYLPLLSVVISPLVILVIYKLCSYFTMYGIRDCEIYKNYWMIIVALFIFYIGVFVCTNSKMRIALIAIMIACQSFSGLYGFMAPESEMYPECFTDIIVNSEANRENFSDIRGIDNRLKDANFNLNANYSFITQTASASGWVNGTTDSVVKEMIRMGYDSVYVRTLDCGGTALTDLCLGYKYLYDKNYNGSELYSGISNKTNVYDMNYSVPFGYLIENEDVITKSLGFQHQNEIYNALGGEGDLFETFEISDIEFKYDEELGDYYLDYEINIKDKAELYIFGSSYSEYDYEIYINDQALKEGYLNNEDNIYFPSYYRNGFLDCGTFENESITVRFRSYSECIGDDIQIGIMPYSFFEEFVDQKNEEITIKEFVQKKNSLDINLVSSKDGDYVIPVGYSENWILKVNGERISYKGSFNDMLITIPVTEGENNIQLIYHQKGLTLSIIISIVGLIMFAGLMILYPQINIDKFKIVNKVVYYIYLVVLVLVLLVVYVIPILTNIYIMIINRIGLLTILRYF